MARTEIESMSALKNSICSMKENLQLYAENIYELKKALCADEDAFAKGKEIWEAEDNPLENISDMVGSYISALKDISEGYEKTEKDVLDFVLNIK